MNRQFGFHFNADNCIGCHSCEAACSEKNNLPPHIAWRTVGFLEGGQFPDIRRMNISMACNHCQDPVCLKGCPTGAFVKLGDTGAVIQNSETCFGCRYCTWVCPYNAPAYNPDTGSVSKCNMCVDRLSVGLKPACVDACLGHALDFGDVERMGELHEQALASIPGFPDPAISSPNIRFQQKTVLPETLSRVEGSLTQQSPPQASAQGLSSLRSEEDSLVVFTLLTQMVVGGVTLMIGLLSAARYFPDLLPIPGVASTLLGLPGVMALSLIVGFLAVGMGLSTAHLGKPWRCYRALNNLRYSWVSREILFLGGLLAGLSVLDFLLFSAWRTSAGWIEIGCGTVLLGWAGIFSMAMIYRIPARPYWNHPNTLIAFFTSGVILGPLLLCSVLSLVHLWGGVADETLAGLVTLSAASTLVGLIVQQGGIFWHLRTLKQGAKEGRESLSSLLGDYGNFFRLRISFGVLLGLLMLGHLLFNVFASDFGIVLLVAGFVLAIAGEWLGRALFYVVVTPMTMPGALFLKNKRFQSYARETGLAQDPCVGVPVSGH